MSWKDFFYYHTGQRIAVIILLSLIVLALVINGILSRRSSHQVIIAQNDSLSNEFEALQRSLKDKEVAAAYGESHTEYSRSRNTASGGYRHSGVRPKSENKSHFVPFPAPDKLAAGETISLNETDTAQWKKVPGIGTSYASRIVKYRNLLGGFASVEQLREVYGIDSDMFAKISPYIEPDENFRKIQINKQEFKELLNHPYLNYKQVKAIFDLRNRKGKVQSINELSLLNEFTTDDLNRLKPYLEF